MPDTSSSNVELLAANLAAVQERIDEAAARSGRDGKQVSMVGVCKYIGTPLTRLLVEAGCDQLGENRPQQIWEKADQLVGTGAEWHLIGHLQRNKVRRTLPWISMLHSADSLRLLKAVNEEASRHGHSQPVLLEVNVSGDESKHGFDPDEMPAVLEQASLLEFLDVGGLMTMASLVGGQEQARRDFSALRQLRDQLGENCPENVKLDDLSMGMSGDFEVAVEEGATLVRIGSALFEGIDLEGHGR
ncbi:MAG: YggS family pyridoxal phosphate-dependent enzyme [Pirellulaceae bacterium]